MRRTIPWRRSSTAERPSRSAARTSSPSGSRARTWCPASGRDTSCTRPKAPSPTTKRTGGAETTRSRWGANTPAPRTSGRWTSNRSTTTCVTTDASQLRHGGVPFDVVFFNAPVYPDGRQHTTSFFARDSWTIGRRLTLNLGARYASVAAFAPEQTRDAASGPSAVLFPAQTFPRVDLNTWNSFEPRLHAALDVSGDGKTVVKGGFGRYHHMRLLTPDVLNFVKNSITYSIYQWRDLNGNNDYDDGETDLNPSGPDFLEQTGMEFDDLPPNFVNNPDEKQPRTDEWSMSLERELIPNFALRVTGLYTKSTDIFRVQSFLQPYESFNIPITNRDPGVDGALGTGDDGSLVTYHEYARRR